MHPRVDHKIIIRNYASLSDQQLVELAKRNGELLTQEALQLLSDEFTRRRLPKDVFFTIMKRRREHYTRSVGQVQEAQYKTIQKAVWKAAIQMKSQGKSDLEIWQVLTEEKEVEHEQATLVIWSLEKKITDLKSTANTEIAVSSIASLFLIFLLFTGLQESPLIGLTIILLIRLVIMFFRSADKLSDYNHALRAIEIKS
jgi:hypothetical protein